MKIEFITNNESALKYYPPIPAKKMIPDWYKEMSLNIEGINGLDAKQMVQSELNTSLTIKGCVPVLDYLTNGYIIRATADILITPEHDEPSDINGFWWRSLGAKIETHNFNQCPIKINKKRNVYLKIINEFIVKTPKGYSCYFYQPEFFMENKYKLFPAIVDTDSYNMNPVFFPGIVTTTESFLIKAGDPLMVVFPFKRDDWNSEFRMTTEKENKQSEKNVLYIYLEKTYKRLFHFKKNFD